MLCSLWVEGRHVSVCACVRACVRVCVNLHAARILCIRLKLRTVMRGYFTNLQVFLVFVFVWVFFLRAEAPSVAFCLL